MTRIIATTTITAIMAPTTELPVSGAAAVSVPGCFVPLPDGVPTPVPAPVFCGGSTSLPRVLRRVGAGGSRCVGGGAAALRGSAFGRRCGGDGAVRYAVGSIAASHRRAGERQHAERKRQQKCRRGEYECVSCFGGNAIFHSEILPFSNIEAYRAELFYPISCGLNRKYRKYINIFRIFSDLS